MSGATTADITFRIDGENVSDLVIRRGESVEFDVEHLGLNTNHLSLSVPSGTETYTIHRSISDSGDPADILFVGEEKGFQGFSYSAGESTRISDNGDVTSFDLVGDVHWDTSVADRYLNMQVYDFKADGSFGAEVVELPQTLGGGYSAGESIKLDSSDSNHTVVAYDGGAYVVSKLSTDVVWNGSEYENHPANQWVVFNVEQGTDGQWTVNNNESFVFDTNSYNTSGNNFTELGSLSAYSSGNFIGGDEGGIFVRAGDYSDPDVYYIDAQLASSMNSGALTKVIDTNSQNLNYQIAETGNPNVVEIYILQSDTSYSLAGDNTYSSIDFARGSETIVLESGSASDAYAFQGGSEISPNYEFETADLNVMSFGGSADNTTLSFSPWTNKSLLSEEVVVAGETYFSVSNSSGHNYAHIFVRDEADGSHTQYVVDWESFGWTYGYVQSFTVTDDSVSFIHQNSSVGRTGYWHGFDGQGGLISASDFQTTSSYESNDWRDNVLFLPDGSPLFTTINDADATSLTLEVEATAEGTWQTVDNPFNYSYPYSIDQADYDGDGFVSYRLTAPSNEFDDFYLPTNIPLGPYYGETLIQAQVMPGNWQPQQDDTSVTVDSIFVTVINDGTGNKYEMDGVQQDSLNLVEGKTYVFDWSGASAHPLRFSDVSDGTHGAGAEYTDGVVVDSVAFTTTITVAEGAPDLNYYCEFHPGMGGSVVTQSLNLAEMLIDDAIVDGADHVVDPSESISVGGSAGDYAYVDRSFGGAVVYAADGTNSSIDFVGNENTFILDASSEFDFFGYSYDPDYSDDSEIVVLEGSVGAGTRSIEFGEATAGVEDWDVVSFDGLDAGVNLDLSQVDSNYDATATVVGSGTPGTPGTPSTPSTPDSLPAGIIDRADNPAGYNLTEGTNGHHYEVMWQPKTYADAKAYAEGLSYNGQQGYLVTITSAEENDFVYNLLRGHGDHSQMAWLGASDNAVESEWVWEAGPETGQHFWTGYTNDGSGPGTGDGAVVNGGYANWGADHLNDWAASGSNVDEDYAVMSTHDAGNYYPGGEWMDNDGSVQNQFVIEYGGQESIIIPGSSGTSGTAGTPGTPADIVAYVDGAEGVFGTAHGDVITGDGGRNILHGGEGSDVVSGGLGQDLVSGGAGADSVYGGAGEDILIDIEGGDEIWGDNQTSSDNAPKYDDTFVVGQGTKVMDFDLSPDGTGLSGRANQANDIVFVQVAAASLAAAGYGLQQIYELVSGTNDAAWRSFVRDLEVEVIASDTVNSQPYNEIRLSIDGNNDGQATDLGAISFLEAGTGSGNYNAVKMKSQLEGIMAQFESSTSDNAHVLEQFFGMDTLTASQVAALERAAEAGEDAEAAGGDTATVIAAVEAELAGETFEAAQAVRDALTAQVSGATPSDVNAAVEAVIDDVVDEALAATDMDTSLFVPVAVEEIREGTVRTEVIEDRDAALTQIAALAQTDQQAADALREDLLSVTTIVDREPESGSSSEPAPEAIVVLSNADDVVVSTSGADDRFEVVPQVFVDEADNALTNQDAGKDVIVDLDSRDSSGADSGAGGQSSSVDLDALGDVVYLEGVNGIGDVNFERQQIGREGQNSLKITTTVEGVDENGAVVASNNSEVNIFKQFDALTDRFAIETLEISDTQGNSEYWSLSTAEAQRGDGRIMDTYITTDVSNTGKGILIGSDTANDKYVVNADADDSAEIMVVGFDSSDSIDLTAFGNDLSTSVNGSDVEVSNANGDIVVTLIGLGAQTSIDEQLIGVQQD